MTAEKVCSVEGCVKTEKLVRGWCTTHYPLEFAKVNPEYAQKRRKLQRRKDAKRKARLEAEAAAYRAMREKGLLP